MDKQSRDYEVCLCNKTTRGEIEDIIREKGYTDLKTFCEETKIGKKCGVAARTFKWFSMTSQQRNRIRKSGLEGRFF